jgi:predicted transcriptional regulator of viral defense system
MRAESRVWDVGVIELAGRQFNRISRGQLIDLGVSDSSIRYGVWTGRLVRVEEGVFAIAPVLDHDDWGRWMGATLTTAGSVLSHQSAAAAWGLLSPRPGGESVTRPGNGGPRRHGGVLVHRSSTLDGDVTTRRGVPITTVPRTLLDLTAKVGDRALARAVREAIRLGLTSLSALGDHLGRYRRRKGSRRLISTLSRYAGLPLERARSGAEVRSLEVLRDAGRPLPRLNVAIAGEEADLSWTAFQLIVEVDGMPFHLDAGEDARKERVWRAAGWAVRRISSDEVYERPARLLALAPRERPGLITQRGFRDVHP